MYIFPLTILIFNFDVFYTFETVGSIPVEPTLRSTMLFILTHVKHTNTITVYTTVFLKMNTRFRNMYEGVNFNSGNDLVTTDTKEIHISKFYCPSM